MKFFILKKTPYLVYILGNLGIIIINRLYNRLLKVMLQPNDNNIVTGELMTVYYEKNIFIQKCKEQKQNINHY